MQEIKKKYLCGVGRMGVVLEFYIGEKITDSKFNIAGKEVIYNPAGISGELYVLEYVSFKELEEKQIILLDREITYNKKTDSQQVVFSNGKKEVFKKVD